MRCDKGKIFLMATSPHYHIVGVGVCVCVFCFVGVVLLFMPVVCDRRQNEVTHSTDMTQIVFSVFFSNLSVILSIVKASQLR